MKKAWNVIKNVFIWLLVILAVGMMIDSSIMGMGKGAGNLNTELLLEHLNTFYGKNYCLSPLLEVIDKVINQLHSENSLQKLEELEL